MLAIIEEKKENNIENQDLTKVSEQIGEKTETFDNIQNETLKSHHIRLLKVRILAPLRRHMHDIGEDGSDKKIRVNVAISIVKLIRV